MELFLIFDNMIDSSSGGIRGAANARHLLFHSDAWDLDIMVARSSEMIQVAGQVLPRGAADLSSLFNAVAVLSEAVGEDELVQSTRLSARGEFEFRDVPESTLRIEIFLKAHQLTASFKP